MISHNVVRWILLALLVVPVQSSTADDNVLVEGDEVVATVESVPETALLTEITPDFIIPPAVETEQSSTIKQTFNNTISTINKYVKHIIKTYSVTPTLAENVVALAHKYERPDFPKAEHILAIIGVESKFKTNTKSNLKVDPAEGLTQIRPKTWFRVIPKQALKNNPENQVKYGALILNMYYNQTGRNIDKTVVAYNIGIGSLQQGKYNARYLRKYKKELEKFRKAASI